MILFDKVFKILLKKSIQKVSHRSPALIYTFIKDDKLVFWLLLLPYLMILKYGISWMPDLSEELVNVIDRSVVALYILVGLFILSHFLRVINEIYERSSISKMRPIKGYLQSIQIIAFIAGLISILSILLNKSPTIFISGLGAMTAILMLVFKDTILSFVAGVQLTSNDLLRVGDWIEMPQFNADGDVVEIALNTVKIQNWDRTFTVIPAHKFLEHSFKNWRGMHDSGGRRIKRSILLDLNSIGFLSEADLQRLSRIKVLKNYLSTKISEIDSFNKNLEPDIADSINARRLTNVGTFRAYVFEYLKNHPQIHKNMTFLVRQLAPGPEGLPLEIYVFTTDTRWAVYETIQADIFDHLYAVVSEFGLRPFQSPSGRDFKSWTEVQNPH